MVDVRRLGNAALQRLTPRARARAVRAAGRLAGERLRGLVTVGLVVEPVDLPRFDDALRSVVTQTHELLDVVVVPAGASASDLEPPVAAVGAAVGALKDPRVRLGEPAADWWTACEQVAGSARGPQLVLLRGCDMLMRYAVADLLGALHHTPRATVATAGLAQFGDPDPWLADTVAGPAGGDLRLLGRMFGTDHWRGRLPGARPTQGDDWLCSTPAARLVAGATHARIWQPVYRYAHDHGERAFGATPSPLPELATLPEREAAIEAATAGTTAAGEWHRHVATVTLPRLLADAERATDREWMTLVRLARRTGSQADRVTSRALVHLAAEDRRADVEALAEELYVLSATGGGPGIKNWRTRVEGEHVLLDTSSVRLPDRVRRLRDDETPLVVQVRRRRPVDPTDRSGPFVAELFCRVEHVDLAHPPPRFEAYAADGSPLETTSVPDRTAERWARARFASAAAGSVHVVLPAAGEIRLVLHVGALTRETTLRIDPPAPGPGVPATDAITGVRLDGDDLVLFGRGDLTGVRVRGALPPEEPGRLVLCREFLGRRQWLPLGVHQLELGTAQPAPELLDALPFEAVSSKHRVTLRRGPAGGLVVDLAPPYGDTEAGPYHQERLRTAYARVARSGTPTEPDVVYFESYAGRTATDSPAAILAELQRRRPGLTAYWGVLDHSHTPAPGATPVVLRSRAHYEVLGRASLVVSNTDLDEWFVHRPDQLVVQTFHGYPAKAMGAVQWAAKELAPMQVRAIRRRTVDTWDLITTPTPAMTEHYRKQYGYQGPVAERGYPRDDALTPPDSPAALATREVTRSLLGVRAGQRAVLYAPTWRDHLATRPRAAEMADHLDLTEAARALGDGYVLLLRGHRFHDPEAYAPEPGAARIVDVTAYPEINDLILASDAAILDYSSLRFDFALTRRPMVFLVPDLDDYTGGTRGFLYPFTDSAPGPLLATTAEVVERLRDLPALTAAWADRLAGFNSRYHPHQDGHATERVVDEIERLWPPRPTR